MEQDAGQLHHDLCVVWHKLISLLELVDTGINLLFGSDDGPAEAEVDVTNKLVVFALFFNDLKSFVVL